MPGLPFQFDSIDENSVLTGFSIDENSEIISGLADQPEIDDFGQSRYFPPRVTLSSPVSDLYPVSLPNLRPVSFPPDKSWLCRIPQKLTVQLLRKLKYFLIYRQSLVKSPDIKTA